MKTKDDLQADRLALLMAAKLARDTVRRLGSKYSDANCGDVFRALDAAIRLAETPGDR